MKQKFGKFDYIFLFILVAGTVFVASQYFLRQNQPKGDTPLFVTVKVAADSVINANRVAEVKSLYFSNSTEPLAVASITRDRGDLIIRFTGSGEETGTKLIFGGQHISLNQRVKVHGLLEAEGTVIDFGKN